MASIKVNSSSMREKAGTFKNVSKTIKTLTDEMKHEIESLRSCWEGEAVEATIEQFNKLNEQFDEKYATINNYASFLEEAAQNYDEAQNKIKQAAEGAK